MIRPCHSLVRARWYTGKPCQHTKPSHINMCVSDSRREASEAFEHDRNLCCWKTMSPKSDQLVHNPLGEVTLNKGQYACSSGCLFTCMAGGFAPMRLVPFGCLAKRNSRLVSCLRRGRNQVVLQVVSAVRVPRLHVYCETRRGAVAS